MKNVTLTFALPDTFTVGGGSRNGVRTPEVVLDMLPEDALKKLAPRIMMHALVQKCGDAMAVPKDVTLPDGVSTREELKVANARAVHANLCKGEWGRERARSGIDAFTRETVVKMLRDNGVKPPKKAAEIAAVYEALPATVRKTVDSEASAERQRRAESAAKVAKTGAKVNFAKLVAGVSK